MYVGLHKSSSVVTIASDVNKDLAFKDKDQTLKAKDQDKDQTRPSRPRTRSIIINTELNWKIMSDRTQNAIVWLHGAVVVDSLYCVKQLSTSM